MSRVTIDGLEDLQMAFDRIAADARGEVDKAVQATGIEVRGDIVKRVQRGPASGRTYELYNPRRTHVASAPGEAPATDTGRLASSINYKREGVMAASVGSDLVYAAALEFGTARIAQRPAWLPAVEVAKAKFRARVETAIRRATR